MQTNSLENPSEYHRAITRQIKRVVKWTEPGLYIIRLRLLSDPGLSWWDVSYCHGMIGDEPVRVELPFSEVPKGKVSQFIVNHAKKDGIYARGLGILDNIFCLN